MRGIVRQCGGGVGSIAPRDGSPDVPFHWESIQAADKTLAPGDEVDYELATDGTVTVVFKAH